MAINLENSGEGDADLEYAHENWCHHFSLALIHHGAMGVIESNLGDLEMFMRKMKKQWLKLWIYRLTGFDTVNYVCKDFNSVLAKMVCLMFSIWEGLLMNAEQRYHLLNGKVLQESWSRYRRCWRYVNIGLI
jgi:hypothetical protein